MRYLINFSYDGSKFYGSQRQKNLKTVQKVIEDALDRLMVNKTDIQMSGRTDKGVHAKDQYAHFDLDKDLKLYNLKKYLNNSFDGEIYVRNVEKVSDSFHARYDVKEKKYSYYINMGEFNPISKDYVYQLNKKLNISLMKKASSFLIGEHDYRAFATGCDDKKNTIRNIRSITFDEKEGILKITFIGNGFLRKMVRNIVGILIEIGLEKESEYYIKSVLELKQRKGNLKSSPACGLYLEKVEYN